MESLFTSFMKEGQAIQSEVTTVLDQANLNWKVKREALVTVSGIQIPDKIAIVRDDTKSVLGVLGDGYQELQNEEMAELLFQISNKTGLELHKGGYFNDGRQVYMQLKSDTLKLGSDTIEGYITACSSHNGTTSLAFGTSTFTISCLNSFYKTFKNLDNKVKHTISMKPRLDVILRGIDNLLEEEKSDFKVIQCLNDTKITPETKDIVIGSIFNLSKQELSLRDALSTRTKNNIAKFESDWNTEIKQKGDNLWGAMSAATRYSSHSQYRTPERAIFNKMMGKTGMNERHLWKQLVEVAR